MHLKRKATVILLTFLLVFGNAFALPALATDDNNGQAGTTLTADVTATGFMQQTLDYDWEIKKTVDKNSIEIKRGEVKSLNYTIEVTRNDPETLNEFGVMGSVGVTNGGEQETKDLKVIARVLYKKGSGKFKILDGASQTINPGQLGPGASGVYPYEIKFKPENGNKYKVEAQVTITNHSGSLGKEKGPSPDSDEVVMPSKPTITKILDARANVTDVLSTISDFSFTLPSDTSWTFNSSGEVTYSVSVENVDADCGKTYQLTNVATLIESDSGQKRSDSASVDISTPVCSSEGPEDTESTESPEHTGNPTPSDDDIDTAAKPKTGKTLPHTGMNGWGLIMALLMMVIGGFIYMNSESLSRLGSTISSSLPRPGRKK